MIARIKGVVWEVSTMQVVLNVGGVGYAVAMPLNPGSAHPQEGQTLELFTHAVYREDSASLYGFTTSQERDFFKTLVDKVSGIGPKTALALLSHASAERLRMAVEAGDVALLTATPGIGRKTAERMILELKGQMGALLGTSAAVASAAGDAIAALISLGYGQTEAQKVIGKLATANPTASADQLLKQALTKG